MNVKRWVAGALLAVAATGFGPSPAKADNIAPLAFCSSTYLCVYWDSHYGGNRYSFAGDNDTWSTWAIANDDSSSWNNGTSGARARIYTGPNLTDTRVVCLTMGSYAAHHSPNDSGDSNVWTSSC